jgi:hypothetical protein
MRSIVASIRAFALAKRRLDGVGRRSKTSMNGSVSVLAKRASAVVSAPPISSASDSTSESKSVRPTIARVRRVISCAASRVSPSVQRADVRAAWSAMTSA